MSINMENPETVVEKIDAASNYVAQIRIALMMGDKSHAMKAVDKAGDLLFDVLRMLEDE